MSAGETEAASALGALVGPRGGLRLFRRDGLAHGRIARAAAIPADAGFRRNGGEDGRELARGVVETHVVIPLVLRAERFHAVADRVLRQFRVVGRPVGIHRPVHLEESAHPLQRLRPAFFLRVFHREMHAHEPRAALHLFLGLRQVIALEHRVPARAVGVKKNGIRLRQLLRRRPRGAEIEFGDDLRRALRETFGEKLHAGVVLMLAGPVRGTAREQQDEGLAVRRLRRRGGGTGEHGRGEKDGGGESNHGCGLGWWVRFAGKSRRWS